MLQKPASRASVYLVRSLVVALMLLPFASALAGGQILTTAQLRGQMIYRSGTSSIEDIKAKLQGDTIVSAQQFPCASCHGLEGEGRKEGGVIAPPLRWDHLTVARFGDAFLRARPAYSDQSLARAITTGTASGDSPLNANMPRYQMTDEQVVDLLSYLKIVGTSGDYDNGLDDSIITVGTVLPITGALAPLGINVESVLRTYFDRVNNDGGIYGRKIVLIVADGQGDADKSAVALQNLIEGQNVFAFIANYQPNGAKMDEKIYSAQIPLVAPISFGLRSEKANRYRFDLLPSFADQAACLVDFAIAQQKRIGENPDVADSAPINSTGSHFAVMHGDGPLDMDAVSGMNEHLKLLGINNLAEFQLSAAEYSTQRMQAFLRLNKPDYVFFFGAADKLMSAATIANQQNLQTRFLTTTAMLGDFLSTASQDILGRILVVPSLPVEDHAAPTILNLSISSRYEFGNQSSFAFSYVAAEVFVEALKRGGRRLSRKKLIQGLESFQDFQTTFTPPITFGLQRRNGLSGCNKVLVAPNARGYMKPSALPTMPQQ